MRQHKTGLSMQTTVNAALYQKRIGLFLHRKIVQLRRKKIIKPHAKLMHMKFGKSR